MYNKYNKIIYKLYNYYIIFYQFRKIIQNSNLLFYIYLNLLYNYFLYNGFLTFFSHSINMLFILKVNHKILDSSTKIANENILRE